MIAINIYRYIYKYSLVVLGLIISTILLAIAFTSSCYIIAHYSEINFLVEDNLLINLLFVVLLLISIFFINKLNLLEKLNAYVNEKDTIYKIIKYSLLLLILVFSILWVFLSQKTPNADAGIIQQVVNTVRNGNLEDFMLFGYLSRHTNNLGFFLISYVLSFIFGVNNYIALGILNSVGIMFVYLSLSDIVGYFGFSKLKQLFVIFLGVIFLPFLLYSTFIYGNILGFLFTIISFKYEIYYLKKKAIFKNLFLSAFFMTIALLFKMNYLISLIAAIIYAFSINIINKKGIKNYFIIVGLLFSFVLSNILLNTITEIITGGNLHTPVQKSSYIVMGLQESERGPGWYTGYNQDIYYQNNANIDKIRSIDEKNIQDRFDYFLSHKGYMIKFFTQKVSTTWNNPLFQSFWINQAQTSTDNTTMFANALLSVTNTYKFSRIYKFFEIFIYMGLFFYVLLVNDENLINSSILLLVFVGNFVFLLFWETKSQYALTSFVLLFPLAIDGYSYIYKTKFTNSKIIISIIIILSFTLVCKYTWVNEFLTKDMIEFENYLRWPKATFEKYQ